MEQDIEKSTLTGKMQFSEIGYTGLTKYGGVIYEEMKRELQFPHSIKTFKQMSYDATISAALNFYESMMLKSNVKVVPPINPTQEDFDKVEFIKQCMDDMEHSWQDFIQEVSSMNTYGFSIHEIVLRKRLLSKGSKYNDGKIGWSKLPIRGQDSIYQFVYSDDGRELKGVKQLTQISSGVSYGGASSSDEIPRHKFLLFRLGKRKDNPLGESPLKSCYFAWKYKTEIENLENIGISRDLGGIPIAWVPADIMVEDAPPEMKAQFEMWKRIVANIQANQQAGLVLPNVYDEITKQKMFEFQLLSNSGGKAYNTSEIKNYYVNNILTALAADVLILGQGSGGSYALSSIKGSLTMVAIESKLKEIANVINHHLIPLTAERNGWDLSRLPKIEFEDLESQSLEDLSKFIQRIASVGLMPVNHDVVNRVLTIMGLEKLPEDADLESLLSSKTTRAGDGFKTAGEGTSTSVSNTDTSSMNLENNA